MTEAAVKMTEVTTNQDALQKLIAQMVEAKEAMNVQRDLLNGFRREARAEGLNLQALNPLIELLGEHNFDRGSRVLSDVISYARAAGTEFDPSLFPASPSQSSTSPDRMDGGEHASSHTSSIATSRGPISELDSAWRLGRRVFHSALAVSISTVLLWLLH